MKNGRIVGLSDRSATSRYIPNINIIIPFSLCIVSAQTLESAIAYTAKIDKHTTKTIAEKRSCTYFRETSTNNNLFKVRQKINANDSNYGLGSCTLCKAVTQNWSLPLCLSRIINGGRTDP
ncbi:hypothetical protein Zmor_017674 [Zophobas morio]|uniref:Uncharacterized protein n=1 Tax=Zophobas morio TaxID=2755281 RepID=A0AA38IA70_9CUCU|nr:hypothetical protein Zmor_017674 [Zophobas morio]